MRFADWEPIYGEILGDFGYSREADEAAARLLAGMLKRRPPVRALGELMRGRLVTVTGPALGGGARLTGVVVAAGGATSLLVRRRVLPRVVVTDLDGNVRDQVLAGSMGAVSVIHAHGDNVEALRRWVPLFRGRVLGTTQSRPFGDVYNLGGFTDGDRAVFLADHFGAREVVLAGFDFDEPAPKAADPRVKRRKLAWAKRLIGMVKTPVSFV